jgi:hypothetical protein
MTPVGVDDPVPGDLPNPQVKGHAGILQIILQPAIGLDQHILYHVADIHSPLDLPIQTHPHHAVHGRSMAIQQPIDRLHRPLASANNCSVFSALAT